MTGHARGVAAGGVDVWGGVRIAGLSRAELLARLQAAGIGLNPAAQRSGRCFSLAILARQRS